MKNVLVVSNFNAGRKKAIRYKKVVIEFLLSNSENFRFISIDGLENIDIENYDVIIAMGGDGTINKVLPYVVNCEKTLGIIPCGTANLLAAKLGIPSDIKKAVEVLRNENISIIDSMEVNEEPAILRIGFGYDADIICKTPQSLKNKFGYFSYFIAGCLFALRLKRKKYRCIIDEGEKGGIAATCLIVANAANMYKNIVSVAKNPELGDGILDVFALKVTNPILFFFEFLKILLNIKGNSRFSRYIKVKSIKIANVWNYAHIDGEKNKFREDIDIKIIPKSVRVFN